MKKLLSLILAILITLTLFTSCAEPAEALVSAYLNLGEKYLLDLDYEQAIVYFNQVIEVEPRNSRAYMGAAEAYVGLGDTESAIAILQKGIELVDDPTELQAMLAELLGENEEQDEVPEDEVVQEEAVEDEPVFETTAVYYYNPDESVSCSYRYYDGTDTVPYSIYWNPVSGAGGYYATYYSEAEGVVVGSGYKYTESTNTFTGFIKNGYIYYITVEAYTGSSYDSRGSFISTVGTAIIQADGTVSSTTGGLTIREDGYYCTISCNQSSFSTDTFYIVYVDGTFYTAAEDTTQSFVLPSGSYEITVIAQDSSNTTETIGSLTLTVGDTSSATYDDADYEYEYDSDGKAISRSITTYAEDGSYSVEYQTRVN